MWRKGAALFGPNIELEGCDAFEEDGWEIIRIGKVEFHLVKVRAP